MFIAWLFLGPPAELRRPGLPGDFLDENVTEEEEEEKEEEKEGT
jgi:hypothetical protein